MEKKLVNYFWTFLFSLGIFYFGNIKAVGAELNLNVINGKIVKSDQSYTSVQKISYGNGFDYVVKLNYYPQKIKYINPDGTYVYSRGVSAVGTIYKKDGDDGFEKLWEHKVRVTFTYDKKSFVQVAYPEDEMDCRKEIFDMGDEVWRLAQTCEILQEDKYCVVSEMFTVFKQHTLTDSIDYVENGHLDLMCDINGNIAVNSKPVN